MTDLGWQFLEILMWGTAAFVAICCICAYGLYRLGRKTSAGKHWRRQPPLPPAPCAFVGWRPLTGRNQHTTRNHTTERGDVYV